MAGELQFQLINDTSTLQRLVADLSREPVVACDLEADSLHHYREQVCLIQFSTPSANYLLDPLAVRDLSPLVPFFANPAIRKVFHGADYDVRSLYRDFGISIENLFDTMIACQFLGEKEWGLAAAVRKRFGVELDKQYQTADWSQRPLPSGMLGYAVLDTAHLIPFYQQLAESLADKGRLKWVEEECFLLTRVRATERSNAPLFIRCKGAGRLTQRALAVLEELLQAREREAQWRDRPPFKVISSEQLLSITESLPVDLAALTAISGLPGKIIERNSDWLLASIKAGLSCDESVLPVFPAKPRVKRSSGQERCLKKLKEWRMVKSLELGMEPGVLIANAQLELLCEQKKGFSATASIELLKQWQEKLFGNDLRKIIRTD